MEYFPNELVTILYSGEEPIPQRDQSCDENCSAS